MSTVLLADGTTVAPLLVADTAATRMRGLLGRDGITGAIWLEPANGVHTFGMRFAIDVAVLDRTGRVLRTTTMPPGRLGRPTWRGRTTVEAEAGAFTRWGLEPGQVLAIGRLTPDPT